MGSKDSSLAIKLCIISFIVVLSTSSTQASRKLNDFPPFGSNGENGSPAGVEQTPPSLPTNHLNYTSETRNGSHAQIVYVNGKPVSESGTVKGSNGHPVFQGTVNPGSRIVIINGVPVARVYSNGSVTVYGRDGKPMIHLDTPQRAGLPFPPPMTP